ncbi:MAG TPA: BamA/TamA family outer membrane protein [Gemmatimonadaceae bacterium]|nr:BamA/TamA family outer membrane protein [Gemmatimonadaceae bacterium]
MRRGAARKAAMVAMALAAVATTPRPARAQEPDTARRDTVITGALPVAVAHDAARLYNQPAALRAEGAVRIEERQTVDGDVSVLAGPLDIDGHVTGRVLVINGNVIFGRHGRVDGALIVIGGVIAGRRPESVGGPVTWYLEPLRYRREEVDGVHRIAVVEQSEETHGAETIQRWLERWRARRRENRSSILLAPAGPYDRVEGLPLAIGPSLRHTLPWNGSTARLRLDVLGIIRSADHFEWDGEHTGYDATAELRIGEERSVAIGARLIDIVSGVEEWQMRDAEVGLASFLFHRDYRDYFNRHGGYGYLTLAPGTSTAITVSYGVEQWDSRRLLDPFTVLRNSGAWRDNPVVDAGHFRILRTAVRYDSRNDGQNPWTGWLLQGDIEYGSSPSVRQGPASAPARDAAVGPVEMNYTRLFLDARRYNRVSPKGQLNARLVLGARVGGGALPLERRFSVSGFGALPGYDFHRPSRSADVLQCSEAFEIAAQPAQCERMVLAQLEYRGDLNLRFGRDDASPPWYLRLPRAASWVVFADAGRGWLVGDRLGSLRYPSGAFPALATFRTDVGAGLDLGLVGVYVAKAVSDGAEPANVFVRVRHRF